MLQEGNRRARARLLGICSLVQLAALLLAPPPAAACRDWFTGLVADSETGRPISGAVVFVTWMRKAFFAMDGGDDHDVHEVLTDEDGAFRVSLCRHIDWNPFTIVDAGALGVFKAGYRPFFPTPLDCHGCQHFPGNGGTFRLRPGFVEDSPGPRTAEDLRMYTSPSSISLGGDPRDYPLLTHETNVQAKELGRPELHLREGR